VLCRCALPDGRDCSVDVVFLIDSSLSVRQPCPLDAPSPPADNWQLVLNFVSEVVGAMPLDRGAARVGVVPFSTTVSGDVIPLGGGQSSTLQQSIRRLPFLGKNTNTTGALRVGRDMLTRAREDTQATGTGGTSRKQFIILLTDGASNVDGDPVKESRLLKQDGVRLITVGISQYVDEAQLKEMASAPSKYSYIYASNFGHLYLLVEQLLSRLDCSSAPPAQRESLFHAQLHVLYITFQLLHLLATWSPSEWLFF